jgi:hypothetical protein
MKLNMENMKHFIKHIKPWFWTWQTYNPSNCTSQTLKLDMPNLESHKLDTLNLEIGHGKLIIIQIVHPIPSTWTWQTFNELFNEKTRDLKKTTHGQHMTTHAWRPLRLFMNMPISSLECCFKIIHGEISKPSYAPLLYYTFTNNNQLKKLLN